MAKFARENLKLKRVAILRDVRQRLLGRPGRLLQEEVRGAGRHHRQRPELQGRRPGLQGPAHHHQGQEAGDDLRPRLLHRRGADRPPGPRARHQGAARRRRRLGLAPSSSRSPRAALDGSYFSNHYTDENPDPLIQGFVKRYKEKFGGDSGLDGGPRLRRRPRGLRRHGPRHRPLRAGGARRHRRHQELPGRGRDHHHRRRPQRREVGGGARHREEQGPRSSPASVRRARLRRPIAAA